MKKDYEAPAVVGHGSVPTSTRLDMTGSTPDAQLSTVSLP